MSKLIVKGSEAAKYINPVISSDQQFMLDLARKALEMARACPEFDPAVEFFLYNSSGMLLIDEANVWHTYLEPTPDLKYKKFTIALGMLEPHTTVNAVHFNAIRGDLVTVNYKGVDVQIWLNVDVHTGAEQDLTEYDGDYLYEFGGVSFLTPSLLQDFHPDVIPVRPVIVRLAERWMKDMETYGRPLTETERNAIATYRARINGLEMHINHVLEALVADSYGIPPAPAIPAITRKGKTHDAIISIKERWIRHVLDRIRPHLTDVHPFSFVSKDEIIEIDTNTRP